MSRLGSGALACRLLVEPAFQRLDRCQSIFSAVRGQWLEFAFGIAFRWRPLVWLGQISYSVYLIHHPLLKAVHRTALLPAGRDRLALEMSLLLLIPIIGLGCLFYLGCEKPFLNSRRRLGLRCLGVPLSEDSARVSDSQLS